MRPLDRWLKSKSTPSPVKPWAVAAFLFGKASVINETDLWFYARCNVCQFIWPGRATREEAATDAAGAAEHPGHLSIHNNTGPLQLTYSKIVGGIDV